MNGKNLKYGAFKGVFTPSILTILGVIMYLRLPWIVGQAGLWATLGIIMVAHLISLTTGLSVASIATDKKVETGGTYYMISRSLGLPIGGTLGLALFVGLSLSVSLYLIGFSETLLTTLGIETTLNNIRIAGIISLTAITILTFISTNLALKTQSLILIIMALSLVSIFFGRHSFTPETINLEPLTNSLPWIALFAIFFPAVTGFEAGVSMSGDLQNPKKAIPRGTILAILVGLAVYVSLAIFFSFNVDRNILVEDTAVLQKIALFAPVVVAGIMGATLSSALGSILGAPRILQATAIDKITSKVFAKGYGATNEPRNALILTFIIALGGILIGELNAIARIVSIFFIITYGFLNLTCAIENWASSDFRPSFRIPGVISIIGALACFIVMIQLDLGAMVIASVLLFGIFLFLKRKELNLQSGDTWNSIWSGIVKMGLVKLSSKPSKNLKNWKPNIILFSGKANERPQLIELTHAMAGKLGIFTNFELIIDPEQKHTISKPFQTTQQTDKHGKTILTRRHSCSDLYQGIDTISRTYGFSGFEPNTVLLGWPKKPQDESQFALSIKNLQKLDFNQAFLHYNPARNFGKKKSIDIWWPGKGNTLSLALTLCKFITSDPKWRSARIRILFISYQAHRNDRIQSLIRQTLENFRISADFIIVNNFVENISETAIIHSHSANTDLCFFELSQFFDNNTIDFQKAQHYFGQLGSCIIADAASEFSPITTGDEHLHMPFMHKKVSASNDIFNLIPPANEPLRSLFNQISNDFIQAHNHFDKNVVEHPASQLDNFLETLIAFQNKFLNTLPAIELIASEEQKQKAFIKLHNDFTLQVQKSQKALKEKLLPELSAQINASVTKYLESLEENTQKLPSHCRLVFPVEQLKETNTSNKAAKRFLIRKRIIARALGKKHISISFNVKKAAQLLLLNRRASTLRDVLNIHEINSFQLVSLLRNNLISFNQLLEKAETIYAFEPGTLTHIEQEAKTLKMELENLQQSTAQTFNNISTRLHDDLEANLAKISRLMAQPHAPISLRPYIKAHKYNEELLSHISNFGHTWLSNMLLFMEKNRLEFILVSLKARVKSKLKKQRTRLLQKVQEQLSNKQDTLFNDIQAFLKNNIKPEEKNFRNLLTLHLEFDFKSEFQQAFEDLQHMVEHLPQEIRIIDENAFQHPSKSGLLPLESQNVQIRKVARYQIGAELLSQVVRIADNLDAELNEASDRMHDIVRLCLVTFDESFYPNSEALEESENLHQLLQNLLARINEEKTKLSEILQSAGNSLDKAILSAFEPLSIAGLSKLAHSYASDRKAGRLWPYAWPMNWISGSHKVWKQFMVKILYSRSQGLLLFRQIYAWENKKAPFAQDIHHILDQLYPSPEVLKEIPYYYQNLFMGNSPINTDMWIGMEAQIEEARQAFKRFQNGYSGAILITGQRNSGKSGLSKIICQKFLPNWEIIRIKPPKEGTSNPEVFHQTLQQSLNLQAVTFAEYLKSQTAPRIIIVNDLELWWARTHQGDLVLKEIIGLVEQFGHKHLFILNAGTHAWNLISRLHWPESSFLAHIHCQALDARELRDMVMLRHKAGGLSLHLNHKSSPVISQWEQARLFNRFFTMYHGNPGFTLQAWLSAISHCQDKNIYLKMPNLPNIHALENLPLETCNLLAQFVLHRRLSIPGIASILNLELSQAMATINGLYRMGLIHEKFQAVYAINPYLEPFIISILKEKELL